MAKVKKGPKGFDYRDHLPFPDRQLLEPYEVQLSKGDSQYLSGIKGTPAFAEELMRTLYRNAIDTVEVDEETAALIAEEHGNDGMDFWREMLEMHQPVVAATEVNLTSREMARWHTS